MTPIRRIAADVGWLPISFANAYFIGEAGRPWVLVDTGIPGRTKQILAATEARFGAGARPEAIILTHGHFDHAGNALELAEHWDVPIYAHPLELPYLTGQSAYPPPDPTIGGAIGFLSRFMPSKPYDFGGRIQALRANETPGLQDWQWVETPGHSPGHVSLFRSSDRVLLAGDAFASMDMESWPGLITARRTLARAGAPFNCDWTATRTSVQKLAELKPDIVGCGHGTPYCSGPISLRLARFAARFRPPRRGRYVSRPALTNERGVVSVPPAPLDIVPFATAASLIAVGIVLGAGYLETDDTRRG